MKQGASPSGPTRRWRSKDWSRTLFTAAVVAAAVGGAVIALTVSLPRRFPGISLCAAPLYRAQVGTACFLITYGVIQAIWLAASGRGFVRFGPRGVEPGRVLEKRRGRRRRRPRR